MKNYYYSKPGVTLYQANSLEMLSSIKDNSVDMIFADPPYNLSNGGFTCQGGRMVSVDKGKWDISHGLKDDFYFHYNWIQACHRVLKPSGTIWISGTYHSIYQCGFALQVAKFHILNDVAWFKPNASPNLSCRFFTASHETLIWARKEKTARHKFNYNLMKSWNENYVKEIQCSHCKKTYPIELLHETGKQMRSVWAISTPTPIEKKFGKHPTQKPIELLRRIVLASTNKGDLVLDPFTGSSTTGIVAYLYGRNFIGIDFEKEYLDLSIRRFEDLEQNMARQKAIKKTHIQVNKPYMRLEYTTPPAYETYHPL